MLDMKIWQKWSNVRSLSCWAFLAQHDMHMTVWIWMCIEWHLCIYIYYEFLFPWEWTKHGGKTTNQKPSKTMPRCQSDFASRAWNSTTWVGRFIGSIQQIVSCETFFGLANLGPSFCQNAAMPGSRNFILSSPTTKLLNLIENQTISYLCIYIYIKAQSINSILFWKKHKSQDQPFTIYPLEIATSELAMEIGFAQRQPCKKWRQVRLLGS